MRKMHSKKRPAVGMIIGAAHVMAAEHWGAAGSEVKLQEGFIISKADKHAGKLIKAYWPSQGNVVPG